MASAAPGLRFGWHVQKDSDAIALMYRQLSSAHLQPCIQLYTKNPRGHSTGSVQDIRQVCAACPQLQVFVHGQLALNMCKAGLQWQNDSVVADMLALDRLMRELSAAAADPNSSARGSSTGVVIHLGKNTEKITVDECIRNFTSNVVNIIQHYVAGGGSTRTRLLLETSTRTKNGSDVFWDLTVLGRLYASLRAQLSPEQCALVAFCIDTAHVFGSGYALSSAADMNAFLQLWDQHIGLQHIGLIHLNDSAKCLGSSLDRHASIGDGFIFKADASGLMTLVRFCAAHGISMINETCNDAQTCCARILSCL